jgi:uncharacterized protein YbjT (DUF2867 family)
MILVVGATGQLGTAIVQKLNSAGKPVRAFVRETSQHDHLKKPGIELAYGDLHDPASVDRACEGTEVIIATANATGPAQKGDTFKAVDVEGYRHLIASASKHNVGQFIYCSVPTDSDRDQLSPLTVAKRETERRLIDSGLTYTIFRSAPFMDVYFALMGSDLPVRGVENPTVLRPFKFSQRFFNSVRNNIAQGKFGLVGDGNTQHRYICIDDVAEFHVRAVGHPDAQNQIIDIGGPEALSAMEVKGLYEKVLGKQLSVQRTPVAVFRVGAALMKPFAPAVANIMALNYISATQGAEIDGQQAAQKFGVTLTSAEEFLRGKLEQPA